ncbi:proton-associated sugar transporter A [Teleopsis dalmanni]|uniref:proton-associated sugar transporter A n=1 Tax=Teleopsis dalmanni TaxID=139649 RepID=UPI0018CFD03A|nr:proton-associated sugar transporter A [Teleopsis dalmanni]
MEKLHEYQGLTGRLHEWRDALRTRINDFEENGKGNVFEIAKNTASNQLKGNVSASQDFSHIYRFKTRMELVRISAAVMGIEFSYAAETAFVSPTLLKIGVEHKHMTLVWALSPLVGFFLCPILGSMSDRCKLNMGRRRPFIILLSVGVLLGLLLVPNGENLGYWFGDNNISATAINITNNSSQAQNTLPIKMFNTTLSSQHSYGIFFTVLGTVLLDFDADACQSPARTFLLDICVPEDHAKGLSTFTIMAGLGGFMGYSMGGINWDSMKIGRELGGHVKAVFTIVTFIFIVCVTITITSFKEIPLWALNKLKGNITSNDGTDDYPATNYGTLRNDKVNPMDINELTNITNENPEYNESVEFDQHIKETVFIENSTEISSDVHEQPESCALQSNTDQSLTNYLQSILYMPHSLRMICLTNLFCWMAHVCYSLYFTDFVGEAVFNGNPRAIKGSIEQIRYEEGVRFGCWGMAMYSLSCAIYSVLIEELIKRFRVKKVYVGGLLFYCVGMTLMALTRCKESVIIFSWTAGVMYSTLFTMPYLIVAHYHSMGTFELSTDNTNKYATDVRGLGTDIAMVNSMVFLAQFILSLCMGTIISISGTTTAVITTASFLSFCGAIAAANIMYLDL